MSAESPAIEPVEHTSPDLVAENIEVLKKLFPEIVSDGKVDFGALRGLLGDEVDDSDEKFGLNWHGKRRARQLALTPSTGTLRPALEDSVDWETTRHLMIEGDNLEVLKLLQKSYAGRVKLIYIDPPYNTGEDFIYADDFKDNIGNYLDLTGQSEEGRKVSTNTETSGRFHTHWLNMMYPRLKLARNLLSDQGIIFISIDDGELNNLLAACLEIFGKENHVGTFVWEKRVTRENRRSISVRHDYLVVFLRNYEYIAEAIGLLPMTDEALGRYQNPDNDPRGDWTSVPAIAQAGHATPSQFYELTTPAGRRVATPAGSAWRYTEKRMKEEIEKGNIWFGSDGEGVPRIKKFLSEGRQGLTPETIWWADDVGTNDSAKRALNKLFDGVATFDTPKPTGLLRRMLEISTPDIVLDFFAGSAPTAEAAFEWNSSDGHQARFICVQLPEKLDEPIELKNGTLLGSVSDIAKERIRRSAAKIREEHPDYDGDLGFRVFKLDSSNIRAWDTQPEILEDTLLGHVNHLKGDRSEQDVLYELLLKLGLDLCVPIETNIIANKTVHSIGAGTLFACLDEALESDKAEDLALGVVEWRDKLDPAGDTTVVFRDSAFPDDVTKTNLDAILRQHNITTLRSI